MDQAEKKVFEIVEQIHAHAWSNLVLNWQLDDVSVCKEIAKELMHLLAVPRPPHVEHQHPCLGLHLRHDIETTNLLRNSK